MFLCRFYIPYNFPVEILELGNHVPTPDYGEWFWEIPLMEIPWNGFSTRKEQRGEISAIAAHQKAL